MTHEPRRGEVWLAQLDKVRPVIVLTRDPMGRHLNSVIVAPVTSTIRGLATGRVWFADVGVSGRLFVARYERCRRRSRKGVMMHGVLTRGMVVATLIVIAFGCASGSGEQTAEPVGSTNSGTETLPSNASPGTDVPETGSTESGTSATDPAPTDPSQTDPPEADPPEADPPEADPPEADPSTTIPIVTSDVSGSASAGNSGGVGEENTDGYSEVIRNDDGTCRGWAGREVPEPWTDGLISGAPFVILARHDDEVLGEGTLGTSSFENVGVDQDQWVCDFPFSATIRGEPDEFRIKVAELDPWVVRRDPTESGQFIASVNTVASIEFFTQCTDDAVEEIFEWQAVGSYWSDGLQSICSNGLTVADIERPCRGPHEGSDYVTKVVSADDSNVVYEDATGLRVDVSTLPPGAPVIVHIATGRPCG